MLFTVLQLVYGNDSILVGEHHDAEDRGCYGRHGIHVTPPKEYNVIQVSLQDLDFYVDRLVG